MKRRFEFKCARRKRISKDELVIRNKFEEQKTKGASGHRQILYQIRTATQCHTTKPDKSLSTAYFIDLSSLGGLGLNGPAII